MLSARSLSLFRSFDSFGRSSEFTFPAVVPRMLPRDGPGAGRAAYTINRPEGDALYRGREGGVDTDVPQTAPLALGRRKSIQSEAPEISPPGSSRRRAYHIAASTVHVRCRSTTDAVRCKRPSRALLCRRLGTVWGGRELCGAISAKLVLVTLSNANCRHVRCLIVRCTFLLYIADWPGPAMSHITVQRVGGLS